MQIHSLNNLSWTNYKNLANAGIDFNGLNLLIGPNNSGKSNFIGLLRFFWQSQAGEVDPARGVTRLEDALEQLGGNHILDIAKTQPARVKLELQIAAPEKGDTFRSQIVLLVQGSGKKVLVEDFKWSYEIAGIVPEAEKVFSEIISLWRFYNANDMGLSAIREAEPRIGPSDRFANRKGDNLALVLDNLVQKFPEFQDKLTGALQTILPYTRYVRPVRYGQRSLNVEWIFEPPGGKREQFSISEISDGALRMLTWATILLSPDLPSLLVIEEPEVGLHVSWMPALAGWIKSAARRTQVIVSTHSPDLLDQFTDEMPNVLVFGPDLPSRNRFTIKRLDEKPIAHKIAEGWQLGDLYRVGDPGVGGWPW